MPRAAPPKIRRGYHRLLGSEPATASAAGRVGPALFGAAVRLSVVAQRRPDGWAAHDQKRSGNRCLPRMHSTWHRITLEGGQEARCRTAS